MKRIQFLCVNETSLLSEQLQTHFNLSAERTRFLISFGAIYCNGQRLTSDLPLRGGEILRCHLEPKRYRSGLNWTDYIVHETRDYLVVNKPAGLPCQAGLDNRIENLLYQFSEHLKQPLFITHRLDIGTSGLVVLAKNKEFQTSFNRSLEQRDAVKIYSAYTHGPAIPPGRFQHWMRNDPRAPKVLATEETPGWKLCELEILSHRSIDENAPILMNHPMDSELRLEKTSLPKNSVNILETIQEYKIQLHTGRTHQIRAQLAFLQNPLIGDQLYGGSPNPLPYEWHALHCQELQFPWQNQVYQFEQSSPGLKKEFLED